MRTLRKPIIRNVMKTSGLMFLFYAGAFLSANSLFAQETQVAHTDTVTTALGRAQDLRTLPFQIQKIEGNELTQVKDANFLHSLIGRTTGVTLNPSSAGTGAGVRVRMSYREAGMMTECLEECDDLILWFSEGKYVYKAMELKMQYKPLSPSQQQKYDHRYEKLSSETEEIPDLTSYLGEGEEKDSVSEGAEALGDTRSSGLTEQPVMENDSTSDVIDTDAVTLEAAEEPDAKVENPEEAGVETAEVIESSEDESEVQPATVETSGDKRTLSKDTASIPIVSKNPVKPVKKKLGDTMRLDEALQQLLNPKPEVQACSYS